MTIAPPSSSREADEEIEHLSGDLTGVEHPCPLVDEALSHAGGHLRGAQPHVAAEAHDQLTRLLASQLGEHPGEAAADDVHRVGVHLLAVQTADVVGLEDRGRGSGDRHRSRRLWAAGRAQSNDPARAS